MYPSYIFSTSSLDGDIEKAKKSGGSGFVSKSVSFDELREQWRFWSVKGIQRKRPAHNYALKVVVYSDRKLFTRFIPGDSSNTVHFY